ncbi:MAG: zinc-binding dehydrogenase [Planctomycetota bacterium]|nr:zinc-binding dehydrogenase [Planctomycetota bacterium]
MHGRIAVFSQPNAPLNLETHAMPSVQTGEVLVRVTCCTICGSDLHSISGNRTVDVPTILGHEIVGRVAVLPDAGPVRDLRGDPLHVGDRVTWSIAASCGTCRNCGRGIPQKCEQLFKYGHERLGTPIRPSGGFSDYCHLLRGTAILRIGEVLSDAEACPANCATATVAAAHRIAGDVKESRVLIFGAGMLGVTAAAMSSHFGADEVVIVDPVPQRLQTARKFGATHGIHWMPTAEPNSGDPLASLHGKFDVVFELSGAVDAVEASPQLLDIGGRLILVGSVSPSRPVEINPELVVRRLIRIEGVHNYRPSDLVAAIDFLSATRTKFPFASLVERTFGLAAINEAIDFAMSDRPFRVAITP